MRGVQSPTRARGQVGLRDEQRLVALLRTLVERGKIPNARLFVTHEAELLLSRRLSQAREVLQAASAGECDVLMRYVAVHGITTEIGEEITFWKSMLHDRGASATERHWARAMLAAVSRGLVLEGSGRQANKINDDSARTTREHTRRATQRLWAQFKKHRPCFASDDEAIREVLSRAFRLDPEVRRLSVQAFKARVAQAAKIQREGRPKTP